MCWFGPDPDTGRLYYGKSFIYPLVAAPFVWLCGTNGFLVLHALLLATVVFAAYVFLAARSPAPTAAVLASGFFFASVTPAYVVWMTPELFNLVVVTLGYFCWLYKEVAPADLPRGLRWLPRAVVRRGRRRAGWHGHLLQAVQCDPDRADPRGLRGAEAVDQGPDEWHAVRRCRRRPVPAQTCSSAGTGTSRAANATPSTARSRS